MKNYIGAIIFAAAIFASALASHAGDTNSAVVTAPRPYPFDYCVVSGEKFGGDMGPPVIFIYQDSKKGINQEIKFCCPMCKPEFLKNPDKYMKIIQKAEAKKKNSQSAPN